MGLGIAFTFIFLAALLAPVAWVLWWAVDSAGARRPLIAGHEPRIQRAARPAFDHPVALDMRLPGRVDRITVYRQGAGGPATFCSGPDAHGSCPIAKADGTVPCAGCSLVLPFAVRGSRDWHIPPGYRSCVVGSYGALRN